MGDTAWQKALLEVLMRFLRAHAPPPTTPPDNEGCEGAGEHDEAQAEEMEVPSAPRGTDTVG